MNAALSTQDATARLRVTAGDRGRQLSSILTIRHFGTRPLFPAPVARAGATGVQHTFTSCATVRIVHGPGDRTGGMKTGSSDAFVWYFPRKPIKDSSPSR